MVFLEPAARVERFKYGAEQALAITGRERKRGLDLDILGVTLEHLPGDIGHGDHLAHDRAVEVVRRGLRDEAKANDAGVDTAAAQSGDPSSVMDLIAHAQQNPGALKDAAMNFIRDNPQAVQQFTPDFLKGIVGKLTGN